MSPATLNPPTVTTPANSGDASLFASVRRVADQLGVAPERIVLDPPPADAAT